MGRHTAPKSPGRNLILPLLPARWRPYATSVMALLGAAGSIGAIYFADDPRVVAGINLLTVLGVYAQRDEISQHAPAVEEDDPSQGQ
ncbi:membrane protein [Streptomyces phage RedBear]|nr:membrane protein [Streptomyces phage RedBear]